MKKVILSIAFVVFGTFAFAQKTEARTLPEKMDESDRMEMMEKRRAAHFEEMKKDLNLTQDQIGQIEALQKKNHEKREQQRAQNEEMRKQRMEMMKKEKQEMDAEMKKILTAEQYQKWEEKRQEKMEDRKERTQKMKMHHATEAKKMESQAVSK